ncbi:hypothetical protein [Stieleria maiorica]|uniref:hypothetical protein n=1 Tax=Stieleria maiorica TaxID=2795974 RepID=UPI00142F3077|nr:hypothetical protein [Stieleria maiorica]
MELNRDADLASNDSESGAAPALSVTQVSNNSLPSDPNAVLPRAEPSAETDPTAEGAIEELALPPILENVDFFSPPKAKAVKIEVETPDEETEQAIIRLIGFVTTDPDNTSSTLALLRVGGKLVPLQAGEEFDGISMVSINCRDRTAEIGYLGERLTLAMMNQPIENPAVEGPTPRRIRRRTPSPGPISRPREIRDDFAWQDPGFETPPDPDLGLNSISEELEIALPEDLPLPEMPELPELEGLPDLP